MNARVEALIEQAKCLNPEERIAALDALQELVAPPDSAWEIAWRGEAEERVAAYERGEIESEDFDVAMERLRLEFLAK
jgi:hypothetical protein